MKKIIFISVIFVAVMIFDNIYAQEDVKSPFKLKEISISKSEKDQKGKIHLKVETVADGEVSFEFHASPNLKNSTETYDKILGKHARSKTIEMDLLLSIIEDGFHFLELGLGFKADDPKKDKVASYQAIPLYFQVKDGEIIEQGDKPNELFNKPPQIIDEDKPKPTAIYKEPTGTDTKSLLKVEKVGSTYQIYIYIYGQVRYQQSSQAYSFSTVNKGLPATRVRIDWDYDNNPSTGYTPYYGNNTAHVDYADVDMNGNFYFSFIFNSDYPANYYASFLRLYGNAANEATFNGDRGNGAQWVPIDPTHKFSLSGLTNYVVGAVNPTIESNEGSALRHIYRAQQFCKNRLGFAPHSVRFYIRTNAPSSWFDQDGSDGENGINTSLPYILFNQIAGTWLAYHEYGHFIEYDKVGYQHTDYTLTHYFELETTENVAWTEGWAEFYNAACHDYWYSTELPSRLEHETRWTGDAYYEFLDNAQSWITPGYNRDNTKVEGAVACFIYSLYDGVATRAPNYVGDNDDLNFSGSWILDRLYWNAFYPPIGTTQVHSFKNGLLYGTSSDLVASINALYSSIILQSGNAKPATPTSLLINSSLRNLQWNDNTCPSSLQYQREGSSSTFYYYPVQNQEQGFQIYRKQGGGTWDYTLNGYTHVATVSTNTTNWTDETYLIGTYSYVVVAYNSAGVSLPKAQAIVTYTEGEIRSNVTMSGEVNISNSITVYSGATLTIAPGATLSLSLAPLSSSTAY